jgi:GDP-L-fucose synthase
MNKNQKIYVAGHRGLVGSALVRLLERQGFTNIITRTSSELNLINQQAVADFFAEEKPEYVFLAAAKVGGIHANNSYRGEFIYNNLMIQTNIMHQSYAHGVKRLLFLGSSCIYPKLCPQPIKEEYLLTGPLEETNSPYAVAKIAGIEMCWAYNDQYGTQFIPVMPTNLYGNNDNFDLENSHVLPALIRKFHLAKMAMTGNIKAIERDESRFGTIPADIKKSIGLAGDGKLLSGVSPQVIVWGSGAPRREFLHVEDMADAGIFLLINCNDNTCGKRPLFNIGTGRDLTIKELALLIKDIVGFKGELVFDPTKPDGTPQKLLDVSRLNALDWQEKIDLAEGISQVYKWYLSVV